MLGTLRISDRVANPLFAKLNIRDRRDRQRAFRRLIALTIQAFFEIVVKEYDRRSYGNSGKYMGPWRPLADSTVKSKRRKGFKQPERINYRTGRLRNAYLPGKTYGGRYYSRRDQKVIIDGTGATIYINVPYLEYVQAMRPILSGNGFRKISRAAVDLAVRRFLTGA